MWLYIFVINIQSPVYIKNRNGLSLTVVLRFVMRQAVCKQLQHEVGIPVSCLSQDTEAHHWLPAYVKAYQTTRHWTTWLLLRNDPTSGRLYWNHQKREPRPGIRYVSVLQIDFFYHLPKRLSNIGTATNCSGIRSREATTEKLYIVNWDLKGTHNQDSGGWPNIAYKASWRNRDCQRSCDIITHTQTGIVNISKAYVSVQSFK